MPTMAAHVPAHFYRLLILNGYLYIGSAMATSLIILFLLRTESSYTQRERYAAALVGFVSSAGGIAVVLHSYSLSQDLHFLWLAAQADTLTVVLAAAAYAQLVFAASSLAAGVHFYRHPTTFAKWVQDRRLRGMLRHVDGYAYTSEVRQGRIDRVYVPDENKAYDVW